MEITEELVKDFLIYLENDWYKKKTLDRISKDLKRFIEYMQWFWLHNIEDIKAKILEDYKEYLRSQKIDFHSRYYWKQEGLSSATINQKVTVVKSFMKYINYIYNKGINYNIIRLPKCRSERMESRTLEEIQKILDTTYITEKFDINRLRIQLIILIAFTSGLRLSEITSLTVEDIRKWKARIVGKWDKKRYVFFDRVVQEKLEEYIEARSQVLPRTNEKYREPENKLAIISHHPDSFGCKLSKQVICTAFRKISKELWDKRRISCHTLRHSFATYLLDQWTNISYIQNLMGHTSIRTTAIYLHPSPNKLQQIQSQVFHWLSL